MELLVRDDLPSLLYEGESFLVRNAVFEVYREMGSGYLESVYQECLEKELANRGVPFESQVEIGIKYKGVELGHAFRADLVCFGKIVVEIKAVKAIDQVHKAQILNYLKATGMRVGFLVNFGAFPLATIQRLVV